MDAEVYPVRRHNILKWSLLSLVLALLIAAFSAWFVWLRPTALGGPASYVVVTGQSMEPTIHSGDLVLLHKQGTYHAGDIVVYHAGPSLIIHRIRAGSNQTGYTLQGDNRDTPDAWHPQDKDVVGRMWLRVPGLGIAMDALRMPGVTAAIIGSVAALLTWTGSFGRGFRLAGRLTSRR